MKKKLQGNETAASETISKVAAELKKEGKKNKIRESVSYKHSICCFEWNNTIACIVHVLAQKLAFPKDMIWQIVID